VERDFAIVQPGGSSGAAVVLVLSAAATAGVLTVAVETLAALLDGFADDFAEENAGCARTPSKSVSNASRLDYKKIASLFYRF